METSATPNFIDLALIIGTTVVLSVARYLVQNSVHDRYKDKVADIQKLSECFWKSIIYGFLWIFSLYVVAAEDFFWDATKCFENYPNTPMKLPYKIWYFCQLGYYWSCFFFQNLGCDVKRKDEKQMMIHHIVTISLISGSYLYGYSRIGGVILCLNDFNDFIYNFGKTWDYVGYRIVLLVCFPIFAITWFTNRILFGIWKILGVSLTINQQYPSIPYHHFIIFNIGLVIMQGLNFFWFFLLCKLLYKIIFEKKGIEDIREEPKEHGKENGKKNGKEHGKENGKGSKTDEKTDEKTKERTTTKDTKVEDKN